MALRGALIAFTFAAASLAGGAATEATAAGRAATIAAVGGVDYRATVTARAASSDAAATATVDVAVYRRASRRWTLALRRRLPETYFWKTATAPHAICRLAISTAASGDAGRAQLIVRLLRTPALGCGRTLRFDLPGA